MWNDFKQWRRARKFCKSQKKLCTQNKFVGLETKGAELIRVEGMAMFHREPYRWTSYAAVHFCFCLCVLWVPDVCFKEMLSPMAAAMNVCLRSVRFYLCSLLAHSFALRNGHLSNFCSYSPHFRSRLIDSCGSYILSYDDIVQPVFLCDFVCAFNA